MGEEWNKLRDELRHSLTMSMTIRSGATLEAAGKSEEY